MGHKRGIVLGQALQGAALVLQAAFPTRVAFLLAGALLGLGGCLASVAYAPFLTASSEPRERTHLFSLQSAVGTLSAVVASPIGGPRPGFFASTLGLDLSGREVYRAAIAAGAGIFALSLLPLFALRPSPALSPDPRPVWGPQGNGDGLRRSSS